jgi:hypothetical protein
MIVSKMAHSFKATVPDLPFFLTARWLPKEATSESRKRLYIDAIVNQLKGGDPVSHCLSPRSPAFVNWILASAEVLA